MPRFVECPLCFAISPHVKRVYTRSFKKFDSTDYIYCDECGFVHIKQVSRDALNKRFRESMEKIKKI